MSHSRSRTTAGTQQPLRAEAGSVPQRPADPPRSRLVGRPGPSLRPYRRFIPPSRDSPWSPGCCEPPPCTAPWSSVPRPCLEPPEPMYCYIPQPHHCDYRCCPEPYCAPPCEPCEPASFFCPCEPISPRRPTYCYEPFVSPCGMSPFPRRGVGPPCRPTFPKPTNGCAPTPPAYRPVLPLPYDPRSLPQNSCKDPCSEDDGCGLPCPVPDLPMPPPRGLCPQPPPCMPVPADCMQTDCRPRPRPMCCPMSVMPVLQTVHNTCCCAEPPTCCCDDPDGRQSRIKFATDPEVLMEDCDEGDLDGCNDEDMSEAINQNAMLGQVVTCDEAESQSPNFMRCETRGMNTSESKLPTSNSQNNSSTSGAADLSTTKIKPVSTGGSVDAAAQQHNDLDGVLKVRSLSSLPKLGSDQAPVKPTTTVVKPDRNKFKGASKSISVKQQRNPQVLMVTDTNANIRLPLMGNSDICQNDGGSFAGVNFQGKMKFGNSESKGGKIGSDEKDHKRAQHSPHKHRPKAKAKSRRRLKGSEDSKMTTPGVISTAPQVSLTWSTTAPFALNGTDGGPNVRIQATAPFDPNIKMTVRSHLCGIDAAQDANENVSEGPGTFTGSIQQMKARKRSYTEAHSRAGPLLPPRLN